MAVNSDVAFKFGCGRYLQEDGAIEKYLRIELDRFGTKALILCGENGYRVAAEKIKAAAGDFPHEFMLFHSTCCLENADETAAYIKEHGFDLLVGVGGGVLMDEAKLVAERANVRLINIPTSSATCAAVTPLSVMYNRDNGATIGTIKLMREVDAVIVDMDIMLQQPSRLFCSGIMDAMAKMIEINHRVYKVAPLDITMGLDMAFALAKETYREFELYTDGALEDMEKGEITPRFRRLIFDAIAVTGVISGISKGSNQCAIAHKFYELSRVGYYRETKPYLHGELVAVGLLPQLAYQDLDETPIRELLKRMKLPYRFSDVGLAVTEEPLNWYAEKICASSAIQNTAPEYIEKMKKALMSIYC